ncbi:MAG: MarR family EPS-associated transcriptional regulator [Gammaproteobacteria bacterium]|nr:MarR family EPS-associated transcriptional regulator [Gammaproteobacteria bacterium]
MLSDELRYRLLKLINEDPELSQRDLARELNISLGKTNYCLRALNEKGLIKARNFYENPLRKGYLYFLTPKGIEEKARVTMKFLKTKLKEYEELENEITLLKEEASKIIQNK